MLKKNISYEDLDGNKVTDTCYFNLSKTEIITLQATNVGGLEGLMQRTLDSRNEGQAFIGLKDLVLISYGERSDDGKRFYKSDEIKRNFEQSLAFDALIVEFLTDENAGIDFFKAVVPKDWAVNVSIEDIREATTTGDLTKVLPPPPKE